MASFGQVFSTTMKVVLSLLLIGAVMALIYGVGTGIATASRERAAATAAAAELQEANAAVDRAKAYAEKWAPVIQRCAKYSGKPETKWPKECAAIPSELRPILAKTAAEDRRGRATLTYSAGPLMPSDQEMQKDFARMEREQRALVAHCKPYAARPQFDWPKECTDMPPELRDMVLAQ